MAQRRRSASMPPAVASHPHPLQSHPHGRPSALRTGMGPNPDRLARSATAPGGNSGAGKLRRSMSRSRREGESTKPEKDTPRNPGIPDPQSERNIIEGPVAGDMGQRHQRLGKESEGRISTDAQQIGSQKEGFRPGSLNTDFASEGSLTAVPEAQTCVYIIKQGISHAIPHRLEPGLRDTVGSALLFRESQKSVYKKLASLSPENIAALQSVLDDGESGPQTRRLVQLTISQKSSFQFAGKKEPAVTAVVEDLYPQRPWRENGKSIQDIDDDSTNSPTYPRPIPPEDRFNQIKKEFGLPFSAPTGPNSRGRLVKRRPHRDIQDVSIDMMSRDDYQAALTTYRVWIVQQHPSLHQSESESQSWTKCSLTEDVRSHDDITRSLLILDSKPPSVNKKRLSLRPDQQTQISRLHETLINNETDPDFQWSLRQLNLIRSKSKPFQLIPTVTAIFVYFARTPRAHVDLQRLFEKQHMPEDDSKPIDSSTANGAQPLSAPKPALQLNTSHPFLGQQPKNNSHLPIRSMPPPPQIFRPPPPLPPDAPHNPFGPPDGFPPPILPPRRPSKHDFVAPPPPQFRESALSSKQWTTTDTSCSDSDWSSGYFKGDEDSKKRSNHETRILSRLVSKRVLKDLGYPWVEEGNKIVVLGDLDEDQVEEILKLSENHNRPEDELRVTSTTRKAPRRNSIDNVPRPLTLGAMKIHEQSFERKRAPNNATNPLAGAAVGANDENLPRNSFDHPSLWPDPILRRKPSDLHLRSNAIARLGIPQTEARVALEASGAPGPLQRSVSDLNLDERRSYNLAQFNNVPYALQQSPEDQTIKQLLGEWTPQWGRVPRGNDTADTRMEKEIMGGEEPFNIEAQDGLDEWSIGNDDFYTSSEHSTITLEKHHRGNITAAELQSPAAAKQDSRTRFPYGGHVVMDMANLASRNDSLAEIERLEEQLSMLKTIRNAKRTARELLSKQLNEKTEHKTWERPTPGVARTPSQANSATVERDDSTGSPSVPNTPKVQPRMTMNEVQAEANTKISPEKPEVQEGDEGSKKPARALTSLRPMETSEAEVERAQRALEDSTTASSESTDPAGAEIVFGSRTRRDVRAAQRQASKRRGSERGRLIKGAADPQMRERRTSRVRSPRRAVEPRA